MSTFVPHIASRLDPVSESVTLKIDALAKKLKAEGQDVVGFGAGEPDFDTPKAIKLAAESAIESGKTKYTPVAGVPEIRKAVAQRLQEAYGVGYAPEEIVVSCGAKHSIFNAMMAIVEPGDEVIIPAPYWVSYPEQVLLLGGKPVFLPTSDQTRFKITAGQLRSALTPRTKLIILNSPSNPTGMVYSAAEYDALAAVIRTTSAWVLSDEIYADLVYDVKNPFVSFAAISGMKDRTILVNGVSKSYAMTGWRIGYLAAPQVLVKAVSCIQGHSTSNPSSISQWASVEALSGDHTPVREMLKAFDERRRWMVEGLSKIPGMTCLLPDGAFYAFPNVSSFFGKTTSAGRRVTSSVDFCDALLSEALVACVPGGGFGADNYIRLSYATSMSQIQKGVTRIGEWASKIT